MHHHWEILESIYKYKKLQDELFDSCANGNLAKFEDLILNHSASPRDGGNVCLLVAIKKGHINIVERLLNDERISITSQNLNILQALIAKNQLDMMKILLPRLTPQFVSNYVLNEACQLGRLEMVILLLQDPRIDPSSRMNWPIRLASQNGFVEIVDLLLKYPRVDPTAVGNDSIRMASQNNHLSVLERLLQDSRVDPSAHGNYALNLAVRIGHTAIVERLLKEPSVLKSNLHRSVRTSKNYNHSQITSMLKAAIKQKQQRSENISQASKTNNWKMRKF
jgi:ankyrin repeat protein